ncbi:hypothetical protein GCM10010393_46870 [Streptomyces gobitricini]|uniref:Uncharacterized protein n=1 Tax=Streptomyces gobitricini TaxID=68211 RepID=A0ABN3MTR0_9ACTN
MRALAGRATALRDALASTDERGGSGAHAHALARAFRAVAVNGARDA